MSFASGFVQGFAGTLAEGILERQKEGREFFNKQVEYARTTGLQNRRKVQEAVNANLSIARQLEQVGVPKEVIMAQINQNPQGLGDFYNTVESIREGSGRDLSPDEWKVITKVGGNFQAPDEDLSTFISRTYDPIVNATSDPGFSDDPEGSLIASMLGFNSMDKARRRLAETEIIDGLTADQLIQYGDVQPQRVGGDAVVTMNYSAIPEKKKSREDSELSTSQRLQIMGGVDEQLENQIARGGFIAGETSPEEALAMGDALAQRLASNLPEAPLEEIQRMVRASLEARGFLTGPETGVGTQEAPVTAEGSPEVQTAPEAPPSPSADPSPINDTERAIIEGDLKLAFVKDNGDGTSTYMMGDQEKVYENARMREFLRQKFQ